MEESKRFPETKKIAIKMGGGGIGAVVLLGGALATAALASAFVIGRSGRSSGKDRSQRRQSPSPEINKQKEQDEAGKEQQFNVLDQPLNENKNPSSGAIKEIGSDNDTVFLVSNHSATLDENPRVEEINGEKPDNICDIEASEQSLCSISPEKLETDVISDGSVVIEEKFPLLDEKLQFEAQNEDEISIQLTKEDVYNEIPKESQNLEQVHSEEQRTESEPIDEYDGEIKETSHQEAVEITEKQPRQEETKEVCYDREEIKVILVDNAVEEVYMDQKEAEKNLNMMRVDMEKQELEEVIFSESHSEDGEKTLMPVLDSRVIIERGNVDGQEKKEIVEIVKENEFIEGSEEDDQMKHVEAQLVNEQEKCDWPDEIIVVENCEDPIEMKEDIIIPCDSREENACIVYPTPENMQFGLEMLEEDVEVTKDDTTNEEAAESTEANKTETPMEFVVGQEKQHEDDVIEGSSEKSEDKTVLSDGVKQLIDQEVEGKIQEDKEVKKGEHDSKDRRIIGEDLSFEQKHEKSESDFQKSSKTSFPTVAADSSRFSDEKTNPEKAFIKKYAAELAMLKDHLTNSTSRRMIIIATLSVLSSLLCSWFFRLSFVELCLVVFLTMVLSTMVTE